MSRSHDLFWANYFGLDVSDWGIDGTSVVPHVGLAGYQGVWFFRRGGQTVVSAPEAWVPRIRSDLERRGELQGLPSEAFLRELFGEQMERCVGPAFHGWVDASTFRPAPSENVR